MTSATTAAATAAVVVAIAALLDLTCILTSLFPPAKSQMTVSHLTDLPFLGTLRIE